MSNKTTSWILEFIDKISAPLRSVQGAADGAAGSVGDVSEAVNNLDKSSNKLGDLGAKIGAGAFVFNQVSESLNKVNTEVQNLITPGATFQSQMAELSAITGIVGEDLDVIGKNARDASEAFGIDGASFVRSYALLLSQLSPEIANNSEALDLMGNNVAILSKSMRGDTTAAAEVLTTAMNQFGVSLVDPIAAAETMKNMMNVMAAAAREGSAELPAIKAALEQVGMSANDAGVSFEETNSAIQVLDKAGRKGSEGGIALRNVMTTLAKGRFLPDDVKKELESAGININDLTDNSKSLSTRLESLKPILNDSALLTKLFGRESVASAMALIDGTGAMDGYTNKITGTNAAVDYANTVMDTYNEKQSRTAAWIENLKIGFFDIMEPIAPFTNLISGAMEGIFSFGAAVWGLSIIFKKDLWVGIGQGIAAMSKWIVVNTIAVGKTILTTLATWGLNAAFWANPITWIVAGVVLLIGGLVLLWNKVEGFRAAITGMWEVLKSFGNIIKEFIIDRITGFIKGIGALGEALLKLFKGDFKGAWESAKEGVSGIVGVDAYKNAYNSAKGLGESYEKGAADGRAAFKKAHREDKPLPLATGINMPSINPLTLNPDDPNYVLPLNERFSTNKKIGIIPFIDPKNSVVKTQATNKKTAVVESGSGSGSGKSVTMNLTINNYLQGIKNPDEFVEIVVRKINDRLNDSLALV